MTSQSVEEWVRAEQDLRGVIGRLEATVEHLQQVRVTQGVRSDQRDAMVTMELFLCPSVLAHVYRHTTHPRPPAPPSHLHM